MSETRTPYDLAIAAGMPIHAPRRKVFTNLCRTISAHRPTLAPEEIGASLSALGLASLYELEQASHSKGGVSNVWVMWEFSRSLGYDFLAEFTKAAWSTRRR
jgi:hypothetical protein